jgi:cell division protein FtsQ
MNVFARSPEDIRARLLRHPWVVSADVQRRLPSRIEIAVRERDPVALLVVEACAGAAEQGESACEEPSALYLVSDEAKMFKRLSGKDPVDLPVITGVTRQRFASDPDFSRRVLVDAVALLHEYRNSGLWQRSAIGEIHVEANDGFSLYVGEDLTYVRLGAPPFTQKLLRMKRVFERLERERARAEYIYLDNEQRPERVTVRLR